MEESTWDTVATPGAIFPWTNDPDGFSMALDLFCGEIILVVGHRPLGLDPLESFDIATKKIDPLRPSPYNPDTWSVECVVVKAGSRM